MRHAERTEPVLRDLDLVLRPGQVHVLDGASGTGKSTLLHAVLGQLEAAGRSSGEIAVRTERTAWISQHPQFTEETVRGEIHAARRREPLEAADFARCARTQTSGTWPSASLVDCSPGELRRVAVARVLARVAADPRIELVLADEPTAHLDEDSAARIRAALTRALRARCALLVATHDRALAAACAARKRAGTAAAPEPAPRLADAGIRTPIGTLATEANATGRRTLRALEAAALLAVVPRGHGAGACCWQRCAALFGVGLTGISGWLIVTASHQPPMLHLMVAIVGVRTFGIGRSVLHYAEQLKIHDAVLRFSGILRQRLWDALVAQPQMWGRLTRSGAALGHLVAEVDEVRDAVPRVLVPPVAGIATWAVVSMGIGFWAPQSLWLALVLGVLAFVGAAAGGPGRGKAHHHCRGRTPHLAGLQGSHPVARRRRTCAPTTQRGTALGGLRHARTPRQPPRCGPRPAVPAWPRAGPHCSPRWRRCLPWP